MLTNAEMIPGRYLRWHNARKLYKRIMSQFDRGGAIRIVTYTKCIECHPKHRAMIRCTKRDVLIQRGKNWDAITHTRIDFSR